MAAAAIPAAASIGGALIGADQANKDRAAAENARNQALAQFANINVPTIEEQLLNLQQYQNAGQLTPEMQQALNLGDTALAGVTTDPRLKQSQMDALAQIAQMASGNPTMADMAGFEMARRGAAGEMQAKNAQVLQEMAQRGQAGSGAELLARLKANQSGADMLQQAQMQQAQAMQQARQAALAQQANLASGIRGQDYNEAANLANARDAIARYNIQNSQNVSNANVGARNNAQAANLQNAQNIMNQNTGLMNQQQQYNKGLKQQQFQNQMNLAGAKAGQYNSNAQANQQQAGQTAGMWAGVGQGVGTILGNAFKDNK